ncbi:MAG: cysE [Microbacterium sp.]|nr:cysE [Microbacterium sp.]
MIDRITVTVFRLNQASHRGRFRLPKRVVAKLFDTLWLQLVVGADLDGRAVVGPGLRLPHGGRLVAIDPRAVIGANVSMFPNSAVGRGGRDRQVPVIGDDVILYRNATVAGPIRIGDRARVGANSLVIDDVPARTTVAGVPASAVQDAWKDAPER